MRYKDSFARKAIQHFTVHKETSLTPVQAAQELIDLFLEYIEAEKVPLEEPSPPSKTIQISTLRMEDKSAIVYALQDTGEIRYWLGSEEAWKTLPSA